VWALGAYRHRIKRRRARRVAVRCSSRGVRAAVLAGAMIAACAIAPAAYAKTPAPYDQLRLGSPDATRTYGQPTITGNCSATASTYQTTVSLSADAHGDGVLMIGSPDSSPSLNSVYELSASLLELDRSTSGTAGSETYTFTSTFDGYGTSFSGTFTEVYTDSQGSVVCTVTIPQSLTLQGTGLTLLAVPPSGGGSDQQQVDNAATGLEQSVDGLLNGAVDSTIQNIEANIDPGAPGTVDATVAFDGSTGQGSSLLVFEGGGSSGSSLLVFDGGTSSGSSVLVFDGSGGSGSSVLVFDGTGGSGSSVLTFDGSTGSGSSVLTFEGSGGSGSSLLVPPTLGSGSVNGTVAFDGSGSNGSALFRRGPFAQPATAASVRHPKKVMLCIRRHKHSKPKCTTLKAARVPFIATTKTAFTTAGPHTLLLPVSKAGRAILTAEREAERLYRERHPHGHSPPKLPLKVVVSYLPSA
jgi:hypothetical protein